MEHYQDVAMNQIETESELAQKLRSAVEELILNWSLL